MEILSGGTTVQICPGCFPLSTDSILLAHFVRPSGRVLDLGAGCATLGLLLCDRDSRCQVTGLELDPAAHQGALDNIRRNGLEGRLSSICADLRQVRDLLPAGSFQTCLSNPPYFSGGPASRDLPSARRTDCCAPEDLFAAAAWALGTGADFYLVHKPEALARLCGCAVQVGLEPKVLRLVRHRPGGPVSLILLKCRKGGKPGLQWQERCLLDADGLPTPYCKEAYQTKE